MHSLDQTRVSPLNQTRPSARGFVVATATTAVGWIGVMIWLSVARVNGYNAAMYDLGNMAQAIASVLRGQPMVITLPDGPLSRLALHVEWFYYLLVPFWALWPDPRTLVVFQALLYGFGALPAYRLGARAAGTALGGLCFSVIYLLYPVGMTAVLFDFHGDTLAMPLLLFALDALDRRDWRRFALWAALAMSCKFYVAGPVGLAGLVFWWNRGERRVGLTTFLAALGYGLLAFFVIRPLFTTAITSTTHTGLNYLSFYFGAIDELAATLLLRILSATIVFGPALLLAWRGWRWLLPALPLAFAALISTGPGGSYDYRYHHYALVVPFVVMACAAGVRLMRERAATGLSRRNWRADLIFTTLMVGLAAALLVDTPLNPFFWLRAPGMGLDHAVYGISPRDAVKDRFLAEQVPPDAPIAVSTFLAPRLIERDTVFLTRYADDPGGERLPTLLPQVTYAVTDALFDWRLVEGGGVVAGVGYEQAEIAVLLRDPQFGLVAADDGLLLFARNPGPAAMPQSISAESAAGRSSPLAQMGPVALLEAQLEPVEERRFRVVMRWQLLADEPPAAGMFAVSRLVGPVETRVAHLPSFAVQPVRRWQPGRIYVEQFEIRLPDHLPAGQYEWRVGWYNPLHPEAHQTDARARIGDEYRVDTIRLP
ncbi:MAG: DUF2079 domain-containing protein [Oscillochloris sp.]|nr:DUF2079 domain-containing protein [Oscillochloris sp.]